MSAAMKQALFTSLRTFNENSVKLPNGDIVDVSKKKGSESYLKAMIQENQGPFSPSLLKAMQFFVDNELDNLDKRTERQLTKSYRLYARDPTAWVESELRKGTIQWQTLSKTRLMILSSKHLQKKKWNVYLSS